MYLMRFDGNRSLRNLKSYFEIEIFSQYKINILVGGLPPGPGGKYLLGMVFFQDRYLSKELISTSKTNDWTIHLEQFGTKLSPINEKQCVKYLVGNWSETNLCQLFLFCAEILNVIMMPKLYKTPITLLPTTPIILLSLLAIFDCQWRHLSLQKELYY